MLQEYIVVALQWRQAGCYLGWISTLALTIRSFTMHAGGYRTQIFLEEDCTVRSLFSLASETHRQATQG